MARKRVRHTGDDTEVNLTPMLDVVFILLIFFIVTASFVKEFGLDVNRPDNSQAQQETDKKNVLIEITKTGDVWIQRRRIDPRAVEANVQRMLAENPEATVVIRAHEKSKNGLFVRVMDQARQAGALNVALASAN